MKQTTSGGGSSKGRHRWLQAEVPGSIKIKGLNTARVMKLFGNCLFFFGNMFAMLHKSNGPLYFSNKKIMV